MKAIIKIALWIVLCVFLVSSILLAADSEILPPWALMAIITGCVIYLSLYIILNRIKYFANKL